MSFQKINIEFENTEQLIDIFQSDKKFIEGLKKPEELEEGARSKNDNEIPIVEMVEKDYHQVLSVFIKLGAKIDVKTRRRSDETLLQVAFRNKYPKTIKVLLNEIP